MTGRTISHYKVLEKLGSGGMGEVWKAEDTQLRRTVALKFLSSETVGEDEVKARLIREAQAAASLDHPNICAVYGIHEEQGKTFIAMAYIDGPSLADKVKERPLPLEDALTIAIQIAQGLQEAHEKGIVHRDIKPQNVVLTTKGEVKIMDFGLAAVTGRSRLTKSGMTLGTPAYISPEQLEGRDVDRRADIWALGCVLYELLAQRTPFAADYEQAVAYGILNEDPEPVTALRSGLPTEIDRIVKRALAKRTDARYQHVDEMLVDLQALRKALAAGVIMIPATVPSERSGWRWSLRALTAVGLALVAIGLGWWLHGISESAVEPPAQYRLTRLTSDASLTFHPAISPDGKLLAYASDRAGNNNLDIWVKTVAGGQPSRRTQHEADDYEPAFSPDSSKIAFRSGRDGGGIYVMPAIAGRPQLIAKHGRRPRFSLDGSWIAYWIGGGQLATAARIYVVSSSGGLPRQLAAGFFTAAFPIWSPDGNHLLFRGIRTSGESDDWWVVPSSGGEPIKTGALDAIRLRPVNSSPISGQIVPETWSTPGDFVAFSARFGDSVDLWRVRISPTTWRVEGKPERLTAGTGLAAQPSMAAGGRLVFASLTSNIDVWSLPVEPNEGKPTGEIRRLTNDIAEDTHPNLSADGKTLVFRSSRMGNEDVWTMDLETGEQSALTDTPEDGAYPVISADGSKVAYHAEAIYVKQASGGVAENVCNNCGEPFHWSADGTKILHRYRIGPEPSSIGVFDLTTGEDLPLLRHPDYHIFGFQISPDGRWIAFHLNTQIFVVPFQVEVPQQEKDWIAVTKRDASHAHPRWSPDGNLLYYQSSRDGFMCIWAQHLNPDTKKAEAEPFGVYHSHSARLALGNISGAQRIWVSVARDKMVFSMGERSGNIWMMERVEDAP